MCTDEHDEKPEKSSTSVTLESKRENGRNSIFLTEEVISILKNNNF